MIRITAPTRPLQGRIVLPSDKSIAHRRLLLAGIIERPTKILLNRLGSDLTSTLNALHNVGVGIQMVINQDQTTTVMVQGRPDWNTDGEEIDCGNSGTTCRLMIGLLAGKQVECILTGDESLRNRPMERVAQPLRLMGASIQTTDGNLPVTLKPQPLHGIEYRLPVASAQVKSSLLFAGLFAEGKTTIIEPVLTRDHTERLLNLNPIFQNSERIWKVSPETVVTVPDSTVPGDPSSAAYWVAMALLIPNSGILLENVALNPTRIAYLNHLIRQGANIRIEESGNNGGEPIGTICVSYGGSYSFDLRGQDIPMLIDEVPVLAVLASASGGHFRLSDAGELRVKESDRISALVNGLRAMGINCTEAKDGFEFEGTEQLAGATIDCRNDHRMAMSFAVAGLCATGETALSNAEAVDVSYPGFFEEFDKFTGALQ